MREIATGLIQLGFEVETDFRCEDQSDGKGPYIAAWYSDKPQPSDAEIDQAIKACEDQWKANGYQRQRAVTYWPLADQLDALYWDKKNGTNVWEQHVDTVKAKFPKP